MYTVTLYLYVNYTCRYAHYSIQHHPCNKLSWESTFLYLGRLCLILLNCTQTDHAIAWLDSNWPDWTVFVYIHVWYTNGHLIPCFERKHNACTCCFIIYLTLGSFPLSMKYLTASNEPHEEAWRKQGTILSHHSVFSWCCCLGSFLLSSTHVWSVLSMLVCMQENQ